MQAKLFGISNCDKVRKARNWLQERDVSHVFHDYKKDGVDQDRLKDHMDKLGWEAVTNKKGTTWRKLPDDIKAGVVDSASAFELLCEYPSIIKRPILEIRNEVLLDFDANAWSQHF